MLLVPGPEQEGVAALTRYVYVDVLFAVNWLMNFLILSATARFCGARSSIARLLACSAAGGGYSIAVEVFRGHGLDAPQWKLAVLLLMVVVGLRPPNVVSGVRYVTCFLTFCFCVAGAAMAIGHAAGSRGVDAGWTAVLGGTALASLGVHTVVSRARRRSLLPGTYTTEVRVGEKTARFESYLDTGNHLRDPISGWPVLVAEQEAVKVVMPTDVQAAFEGIAAGDDESIGRLAGNAWSSRIRVIPFDSLGKRNGMLLGFKPDSLVLSSRGKRYVTSRVVIGIYGRRLSTDGAYSALVGPEVIGSRPEER
jgi:stage II sporulation protein GA (sporulation sigma-E factor processing peptidase)